MRGRSDPNLKVDFLFTHGSPKPSWISPLANGRSPDGVFSGHRAVRGKELANGKVFYDVAPQLPFEFAGWVHPKIPTVDFIESYFTANAKAEAFQDDRWQKLPYDDMGRYQLHSKVWLQLLACLCFPNRA